MAGGLDQGGTESELDRLAVLEWHLGNRLCRVGLLGHRDGKTCPAQLGHKAEEDVEH